MACDTDQHHRRSLRLPGYDYTREGAYFVTICTHHRACLFGEIVDDEMRLNGAGLMVQEEWLRSAEVRTEIELSPDEFVVMPNHIHGIVWITEVGAHGRAPLQKTLHRQPCSLASFIAGFKSITTKRINEHRATPGVSVWQRNYYEHIIRDDHALNQIREYIVNNPMQWAMDRENPDAAIWTVGAHGRAPVPKGEPWRA